MSAEAAAVAPLAPYLPAARRILGAGITERRNTRFMWLTWGLLALSALEAVAVSLLVPAPAEGHMRLRLSMGAMGLTLTMVMLMWWSLILYSALLQHSSFEAMLVPAMARRIRISCALLGLAVALFMAVAAALMGLNFWISWAVSQTVVCLIAWLYVQPMWMVIVVWTSAMLINTTHVRRTDFMRALLNHDPAAIALVVTLAGVFAIVTFIVTFAQSPERKEKMSKRLTSMRRLYALDSSGQSAWASYGVNRWTMQAPWSYTAQLARMLSRPTPITKIAPMMFGPPLHWSMMFNVTVAYAVSMLLGRGVFELAGGSAAAVRGFLLGSIIFAFMLPLLTVSAVRSAVWMSRGEQALLILTPKMPQGKALNRLVANFLLQRVAVGYVAGALVLCLGVTLSSVYEEHAALLFLALLTVPAPIIPFTLFQSASMTKPNPMMIFLTMMLAYATAAVIAVNELWLHLVPVGRLEAAIVVMTILWGIERYRKMVNGPCQFPAGRLDSRVR